MRALKPGARMVLIRRLPSLEIFAADWSVVLSRQLVHYWNIHRQVRRSVGERHALHQRSVGINHRGRDVLVIRASAFSKDFNDWWAAVGSM